MFKNREKDGNLSVLAVSKLPKECGYKKEDYSVLVYGGLDDKISDFFPQDGRWLSCCFSKSDVIDISYLPCHIRDDWWLAELLIQKYDISSLSKEEVVRFIKNSEHFNRLRYEYEQRVVSWQINWMNNDGENWIVDEKLGGDFYMFSSKADYAFRQGVVDTLLAIGMDRNAIEEGIERNVSKWRLGLMKVAFRNTYTVVNFSLNGNDSAILPEPSDEHFENWYRLRLYEYYLEHKESVDKYGVVLPEMLMDDVEVFELRKWLSEAHDERMLAIEKYKNRNREFSELGFQEIDYNDPIVLPVEEYIKMLDSKKENKFFKKELWIKRLFRK